MTKCTVTKCTALVLCTTSSSVTKSYYASTVALWTMEAKRDAAKRDAARERQRVKRQRDKDVAKALERAKQGKPTSPWEASKDAKAGRTGRPRKLMCVGEKKTKEAKVAEKSATLSPPFPLPCSGADPPELPPPRPSPGAELFCVSQSSAKPADFVTVFSMPFGRFVLDSFDLLAHRPCLPLSPCGARR